VLSTASNKVRTDGNQTYTVESRNAVSTVHQFSAKLTIITTQKFQDMRGQIDLEKTGAKFRTFIFDLPKPE
jgi:hypothetical protein